MISCGEPGSTNRAKESSNVIALVTVIICYNKHITTYSEHWPI